MRIVAVGYEDGSGDIPIIRQFFEEKVKK